MLYSRRARSSLISLTAMTRPVTLTKRTMCREIPRGRAASRSSGHSLQGSRPRQVEQGGVRTDGGDLECHGTIVARLGGLTARREPPSMRRARVVRVSTTPAGQQEVAAP